MRRLRSLLPWSWSEREQAGSNRPMPTTRSIPSLLNWFDEQFEQLNRSMQSFFEEMGGMREFNWRPSSLIQETENEYIVKVDLPGVNERNLKVELREDNLLHIFAERRFEQESNPNAQTHLSEIAYGVYSRTFSLPPDADPQSISAELSNGVLTIRIPRSKVSSQVKQIQVQTRS